MKTQTSSRPEIAKAHRHPAGNQSALKRTPTFSLLRERRKLPVINPATGERFTISLRDWHGVLWAVRVFPAAPYPAHAGDPFVQCHRILPRSEIEQWLERLRLPPRPPLNPRRKPPNTPASRTNSRSG